MVDLIGAVALWTGVGLQFYVTFGRREKLAKGRLLTMPLRRWMIERGLSKRKLWLIFMAGDVGCVRFIVQQPPVMFVWLGLLFAGIRIDIFYGVFVIALYVDDLLSDTDWKKKWKTVTNKIKWKWLPEPRPALVPNH